MFDRRLITNFNWPMLLVVLFLCGAGLTNLYSATSSFDAQSHIVLFRAQVIWSVLGFAGIFLITSIHYRHFRSMSYVFYGMSLVLLVLVLVIGRKISGHQSWLVLGPLRLQPSEIAKLGLILGLSRYLTNWQSGKKVGFKELLPAFMLFIVPTLLILMQGDLGSSLFFGLIFTTLILIHGVNTKIIVSILVGGIIIAIVGYLFFLSPYQKNRIATFMNPEMDHRGTGYHLVQSKIAVGSGSLMGKGFMKGQSHKLKFVPERHTDFIFPVFAEEWGFIGCAIILVAFLMYLFLGLEVANRVPDRYAFYLSVGICALVFWHLVINLGGVLGLMPLTGVPLPFFSYGGSALLTNWIGLALLLNISMRRYLFS